MTFSCPRSLEMVRIPDLPWTTGIEQSRWKGLPAARGGLGPLVYLLQAQKKPVWQSPPCYTIGRHTVYLSRLFSRLCGGASQWPWSVV